MFKIEKSPSYCPVVINTLQKFLQNHRNVLEQRLQYHYQRGENNIFRFNKT